jgi:hypothetical protein
MITTKDFEQYLQSMNLDCDNIVETDSAFEATLSMGTVPNLKNFTQVLKNEDETWWVRLSKEDLFNDAITNGFFAHN